MVAEYVTSRLNDFIQGKRMPHILFYGPPESDKLMLVKNFIFDIYGGDQTAIKKYTMISDCIGKGIKYIREELKLFSKNMIVGSHTYKCVVLVNADNLTFEAQYALRRCIEVFSKNTRFFIILENKNHLLTPLLSRMCEIYVHPEPEMNSFAASAISKCLANIKTNKWLIRNVNIFLTEVERDGTEIIRFVDNIYEKGYSSLDLINSIDDDSINIKCKGGSTNDIFEKFRLLSMFHKVKVDIRNEKSLLLFILSFLKIRSVKEIENIMIM